MNEQANKAEEAVRKGGGIIQYYKKFV
jgi:hypothetical protein